ncbi:MAG: glutamyl-tRNA reductase [Verrucomicrobiota bacterium]|nr:glutamyl-tRNA reductase [Verrucomicrobiota bacterium]
MKFFCIGINHHSAPVEIREQIAISEERYPIFCKSALQSCDLTEIATLSTCNRVEIYAVGRKTDQPVDKVKELLLSNINDRRLIEPHIFSKEGEKAIEHLFEVASGVDSMIFGETEILGQVKQAYEKATEGQFAGKILNRIFQKTFQTAKQVRSQTNITKGHVSVSSVAATLAEKIYESLDNLHVMIIGAGEISQKTARTFVNRGVSSVSIVNRSLDRAEQIARDLGVSAHLLDDWQSKALEADIIVSSTSSPNLLITRKEVEDLMSQRPGKPLFLIDLAVPRDIDPSINWMDDCYLYNIDDLQAIADEASSQRIMELAKCREIIRKKTNDLFTWVDNNTIFYNR